MPRTSLQIAAFVAFALSIGAAGCGRPELTNEDLGTIHHTIPEVKGAEGHIAFPKRKSTVTVVQPSSPTQPVAQSSQPLAPHPSQWPATQPGVQSTGSTLPASQPGTQPVTQATP